MLAVHWVNNTCAGVKIVLLVHREDKVPPPPLFISLCLPLCIVYRLVAHSYSPHSISS